MPSAHSTSLPKRPLVHGRKDTGLSEARLENSQRIARLGDWEHDFVNQHLLWSEEVYRILGLERKDCPPDSATFYRMVHPDDLALVHRQKNIAAHGLRCVDFEHRIIRPDGEVRHIHQIAEMVYDEQGRQIRETGTLQDITERKRAELALRESEERFKLVARAVSDVVWDWDIPANTLWWSEGFHTTFGFTVAENKPGIESWSGHIHPDERVGVVAGIHHAIDTGAASWSADCRFQRQDDSYAFVQNRGYIFRDAAGHATRMVGGMRDLTEQKNQEAQHLRAQRLESIGTLAGGIAHDLNNVLAPIMMSIDLLKLDASQDLRRTRILDIVHRSCRRGANLVRQILAFARGIDGQRIVIRLRQLIDDLEGIISVTFPRNIAITSHIATDLAPFTGDPTQLHQVLLNLAVNARDAMPHGGTLTLVARNITLDALQAKISSEAKAGTYVLLEVTDTGEGMSPAVCERIFEPFFTTKEIGRGTGLGLATVHTIVKSHGGFLQVASAVGRGTTFKVYLPADTALSTTASSPPFLADLPRGRAELVLVVDDEFSVREITRQTLKAFGYRVLTASDGAEAVALYARQPLQIAAVITDMMMPVMDGNAAIQTLRRINPDVRIIAASGLDSDGNLVKANGAGMHDFLHKPYAAETLLKLLREVLDRPAAPTDSGTTSPPG
jgi:PAS domain S-box-containing protein